MQTHARSLRQGPAATIVRRHENSADENKGYYHMDKDRIEGTAKQAKGPVREVVGEVVGDAKLHAEGKADEAEGSWQQKAVGSLRDTHRKACAG